MKEILAFCASTSRISFLLLAGLGCLRQANAANGHWVGTWACGPQLTENGQPPFSPSQNNLPPIPLANSTLRQFVHTTIGGQFLRVRFSNAYGGTNSFTIESAHVALAAGTGSAANGVINPATDMALTFRGSPSVTVPPGMVVYSDPFDFNLPPLTNLAVTVYLGAISPNIITGHPGSRTTSYIRPGNWVSASAISNTVPGTATTQHWYILTGVDVLADQSSHALAIIGDSITDGRGSDTDGNDRWPDDLAARLSTNPPTASVGVLNMGIGGGAVFYGLGPEGINRFDRDTWEQSGARWLIVFIGVNDIGGDGSSTTNQATSFATNMIAAYTTWASKAHAHNMLAYGATITPFGGNGYYTPIHEYERQYINAWFRTNNVYDGVIDLDAALRDPSNPTQLLPAYEYEWLHLNPIGTQAAANAINLSLFTQ
ncbi:MAG TPA: SGNH/GDSL hydrolase family protein [Candidatus Saccharimonadales bacterium]|nr:SGNH/GDSL hydrolase family protein [Candidatus Saccharimonadales bacterium]